MATSPTLRATMRALAPLIGAVLIQTCIAAPYIPASDATPLERLPGGFAGARESQADKALQSLLNRNPNDVDVAIRVAQRFVSRAKRESDPRLLGQAEAVLTPWWSKADPPTAVALIRASIRQSNHDFAAAKRDLDSIAKREPTNAQALLILATLHTVTADFDAAAQQCKKLSPLTDALIATTCVAAIDGVRGHAARGFDSIETALVNAAPRTLANVSVRTWALTLQAELAERLGRTTVADRMYTASLQLDPNDTYTVAAYCDFLIDSGRANDVLALVPHSTRSDTLLLRRAIAAKLVGHADAPALEALMSKRFAASRARGDRVHLREESRFALRIKNAPTEALELALANWQVQKEPLDARIALEAAIMANNPSAVVDVIAWIENHRLQGDAINALVKQAKEARVRSTSTRRA